MVRRIDKWYEELIDGNEESADEGYGLADLGRE
jgi:hypothetical protein